MQRHTYLYRIMYDVAGSPNVTDIHIQVCTYHNDLEYEEGMQQ